MSTSDIEIERAAATAEVAADLALLHARTIGDGFLTSLGHVALVQVYLGILRADSSFVFTARRDGDLVGYIACSTSTGSVMRQAVLSNPVGMAQVAVRLFFKPRRIVRALETLRYPSHDLGKLPECEILNFSVDPAAQGLGVGQALFATALDEYAERGITAIRIVTGGGQESAQRFYEAAGGVEVARFSVHAGSESVAYRYDIRRT